jgi:two-component system response regulator YesN
MTEELQPRILLVDDEPDILDVLMDQLRDLAIEIDGFKIPLSLEAAENGLVALDLLKCYRYDVVISDIRMPTLDGLELVTQLQKIEPATKVILISGHADKAIAIRAIRLGVFDLIEKPWHSEQIREAVKASAELGYRRRISEIEFEKKMARYAASMPADRYEQLRNALRTIMLNDSTSNTKKSE